MAIIGKKRSKFCVTGVCLRRSTVKTTWHLAPLAVAMRVVVPVLASAPSRHSFVEIAVRGTPSNCRVLSVRALNWAMCLCCAASARLSAFFSMVARLVFATCFGVECAVLSRVCLLGFGHDVCYA